MDSRQLEREVSRTLQEIEGVGSGTRKGKKYPTCPAATFITAGGRGSQLGLLPPHKGPPPAPGQLPASKARRDVVHPLMNRVVNLRGSLDHQEHLGGWNTCEEDKPVGWSPSVATWGETLRGGLPCCGRRKSLPSGARDAKGSGDHTASTWDDSVKRWRDAQGRFAAPPTPKGPPDQPPRRRRNRCELCGIGAQEEVPTLSSIGA